MGSDPFFCESCQNTFGIGQQVELDGGYFLPICGLCWNQMDVGDRLKVAGEVRKQYSLDRIADAIVDVLKAEAESRRRNPFEMN